MTVPDVERMDLEAEPVSVGAARRFVSQVLQRWGLDAAIDTAALLTSELATNAVLHARSAFAVVVARVEDGVRVDVLDGSTVRPVQRPQSTTSATGRGVAIVAELAAAWGTTSSGDLYGYSKGVWFTVPVAGVESGGWQGDWLAGL